MIRTIARVLVVLLAAGGIIAFAFGTRHGPHLSFLDRPTAAPPSAPTSSRDATPTTGDLTPTFRAVEAFAMAVPKDTFEPEAVLAKTGRDPSAIFAWVRDETVWVPYGGVLRGPTGVLMDRTGNDLDRALLLAQLLKAAGRDVRLARGTLSDAQANAIIAAARPRPHHTPRPNGRSISPAGRPLGGGGSIHATDRRSGSTTMAGEPSLSRRHVS